MTLAACTATVSGTPSPEQRPSEAPGAGDALKSLDACTVLNQLLADQGFNPGERKTVRNECVATKIEYGALGIALDPVQGLDDLAGQLAGSATLEVNGRKGIIGQPSGEGSCEVGLEVGEHARAVVIASISRSDLRAQVCTAAQELAAELEPLLPRG
ncbi:hypothetical protein HNR02_003008 [Amycolatopsis endophytica]|uniref:DUF3558 domain-containing protein n=1 Tax=Amycolatopsis endophytica TaxID=860233 RepID=A0A853B4D4_9PSEU|nr:DUF3558 domain-containing protein [Amycolatopsis endophytica]NYI89685.1 hypothetical protein [Amycolatopsis endophytica]